MSTQLLLLPDIETNTATHQADTSVARVVKNHGYPLNPIPGEWFCTSCCTQGPKKAFLKASPSGDQTTCPNAQCASRGDVFDAIEGWAPENIYLEPSH